MQAAVPLCFTDIHRPQNRRGHILVRTNQKHGGIGALAGSGEDGRTHCFNSLAAWLEDCCILAPGSRSQIGTANKIQVTRELGSDRITKAEYENEDIWLYANYRAYCERTGHSKPVTMRKFSDSLVDLCRNQLKNPEVEKLRDWARE